MRYFFYIFLYIFISIFILGCDIFDYSSEPNKVLGCIYSTACNYNQNATINDGSCVYEKDCTGICGGTAAPDECGVCGGNGDCACPGTTIKDCLGVCGGLTLYDECGVCGGSGIPDGKCDCLGNVEDECGVCDGGGIPDGKCDCDGNILDCNGECRGGAVVDECGDCGGDGSSCEGVWPIYYDVSTPIGGFQFKVNGVTVVDASGGVAGEAGFSISTSNNIILSFSFSGGTIQAGSDKILTIIEIEGDKSSACLSDPVISNSAGVRIDVQIIDCQKIKEIE